MENMRDLMVCVCTWRKHCVFYLVLIVVHNNNHNNHPVNTQGTTGHRLLKINVCQYKNQYIKNYKINTLIMNHAFRLITVDTINIILQH